MLPRPVIISTVRDAADVLGSFVAYHRAIGFSHFYLFFDDPADPAADRLAQLPDVTAIRCDQELRSRWAGLASWPRYRQHVESEVMARQLLNCELAIGMAAADRYDWILHIDSDELLMCESGTAPEHFAALQFRGVDNAVYMNLEALPEKLEIGDYFREVTLFKVNGSLLGARRFSRAQIELARGTRFSDPHCLFHLYDNGKSAARIGPDLVPLSVHEFGRIRADGRVDQSREICGDSQLILHYPNCGLGRFVQKYRTLGSFADKWFGTLDVIPFHREARDIVGRGDAAEIERLYRDRVMLSDQDDLALLLGNGILRRIDAPSRLLDRLAP